MICGHVNTKECLKRRKLNIVVSSGEVAQINNESRFAQYGSYISFTNMFGLNCFYYTFFYNKKSFANLILQ